MHYVHLAALAVAITVLSGAAIAADEPQPDDALTSLRKELAAMRVEAANTKLQLRKTLAELKEVREFLASKNIAEQMNRWRAQRAAMAAERRQLALERRRLEQLRLDLREAARRCLRCRKGNMGQNKGYPDGPDGCGYGMRGERTGGGARGGYWCGVRTKFQSDF